MKRIIHRLLLTEDKKLPLASLSKQTGLRTEDILSVCTSEKYCEFFEVIEGEVLRYRPPFGIVNRRTLIDALQLAFPRGIKTKVLDSCYEFALSDLNSLVYENKVYRLQYGKSSEGVLFAPQRYVAIDLSSLWQANLDVHLRPTQILPPKTRLVDVIASALQSAEIVILNEVLRDLTVLMCGDDDSKRDAKSPHTTDQEIG